MKALSHSLLLSALCLTAGGSGADDLVNAPVHENPANNIVMQKLMMLESLLASQKIKGLRESGSDDAKGRLTKAESLKAQALSDLAAGRIEDAEKAVNESLRTASTLYLAIKIEAEQNAAALQSKNEELEQQVRSYISAISDAQKLRGKSEPEPGLLKVIEMLVEAKNYDLAGNYSKANRILAQSYRLAIVTLSELRAGETVVLALKFDSPADEYAYELKRHHSHQMLIEMVTQEGKLESRNREDFDKYIRSSRELHFQGENEARSGRYTEAIKSMESATTQLVRALQLTGMAVF